MTTGNRPPYDGPTESGHYGEFGGRYVAETLMSALDELSALFEECWNDPDFRAEFQRDLVEYVGRPTPLYLAERLTAGIGGARIYLKREDLNHTGAHKINNTLGQALLAKRMGKQRVIAETGAGQHGVATATVAARLGLECDVFMGEEDIRRQSINVFKMKMLGARVIPVRSGSRTLKDAMNEAMRDWVTHVDDTHYIIGSVAGPHPYPMLVRELQSVIGNEARAQCLEKEGRLPDLLIACVGGGSNAMGLFYPFVDDESVDIVGVEAAGHGIDSGEHAAPLSAGTPGVLHGSRTYVLDDDDGQIVEAHSISAGLDYPGVGPEHSYWKDIGRARYVSVNDQEALAALKLLNRTEGILPALESSHAIAWAVQEAERRPKDDILIVNLSGRGDKDIDTVARIEGIGLADDAD